MTWMYVNRGRRIEGGFTSQEAAQQAADQFNREWEEKAKVKPDNQEMTTDESYRNAGCPQGYGA